jgi:hypothetical protein
VTVLFLVLLLAAAVCFGFAAAGVATRVNPLAAGLFLCVVARIVLGVEVGLS